MVKSVKKANAPLQRPTQAERTAKAEEKMVNATIELLNTDGLAGTTLIAIGESAGYSRGLASHHFGSKSGLFRKVLRHLTAVWTEELESNLEGREGLTVIELGIPPDCELSQAVEMVQAAVGELPLIVRVPMERAVEFAGVLAASSLAAISLAPPRGAVLNQQGQAVRGRLFGPAVFPFALAAAGDVIDMGVPLFASGGIYQRQQVDALLELGAMGVQLDAVLWGLGKMEGWEWR